MNVHTLPNSWKLETIASFNVGGVTNLNPLLFPSEQFEYYSIPAYQNAETPQIARGHDILSQKLLIPPSCVLFGKLNPRVEKVWNVKSSSPLRCIASTEWLPITPRQDINQDFIYFLMYSDWVMPIAQSLVSGSTPSRQRVQPKAFYEIPVPVPEIAEQREIAEVLCLFEKASRNQLDQIQCLQKLKRAAMRKLFTCGLRGEPQKETEIGPLPKSWELTSIGNAFEIEQGLSLKGNLASDDQGTPFLRTSNVYWGRIELQTVSQMYIRGDVPSRKLLRRGDLLVCEGGEIGRAAVWHAEIDVCLFQNHIHRLRPLDVSHTHARFTMAWLEEGFKHRNAYEGAGNRTTIPNLSRSRLAELLIPHPPLDEQHEIVTILDAIDRKIDLHRKKRTTLNDLFKALLHRLMTGEIRVADLDFSEFSETNSTNVCMET